MNIVDLERTHEISFHDSDLCSLSIDFVERTVEFILNVCVGEPGSADPERRRRAHVVMSGLEYLVLAPPDPTYPYQRGVAVDIDPCGPDETVSSRYQIPQGAFSGRFFVSDWNSFIHFAAMDVQLTWLESKQ